MKKRSPQQRISLHKLTTRMEAYRLWFEYLKVAMTLRDMQITQRTDKALIGKIERVRKAFFVRPKFYEPWNVELKTRFDPWWQDHSNLFEEKFNVRVLREGESKKDPNAVVIEVPLNRSVTEISKRVSEIVRDAQVLKGMNKKSKSKVQATALYQLSKGSEPKLDILREMLSVFRDVYLKDPKLRGEELVIAVQKYYSGRKNKRFSKVPKSLTDQYDPIAETVKRNARRYINNATQVLVNVAAGEFPGKY